ncbi:MAG: hypothetical protein PHQ96_08660, partial [Candidatus Omnitrophica bacterium]|nr:hypothetical protein [Candidatus Omnitrophota bacterium]
HSEQIRAVLETQVEEVKPDGGTVISQRIKEESFIIKDGPAITEADSTDPALREKAKDNPSIANWLKSIEATGRFTIEPTGDIETLSTNGDTEGPNSQHTLKNFMMQPMMPLPKQEIKIGDTWDMGSRSNSSPPMGRLATVNTCVLSDIRQEGKDKIAVLQIKGDAKLEPDPESDVKYELEDYKIGGEMWFSLTRGRFIFTSSKTEFTYKVITLTGAWFHMRATSEMQTKEIQ